MSDIVEVTFEWESVKLRWQHHPNWYVEAVLVKDVIFYNAQLASRKYQGRDSLKNPTVFPHLIQDYRNYKHA